MHIAARNNDIHIGQILVEFDARIGRRNYEGLTPLGVARMNRSFEYIELLNSHYVIDSDLSSKQEEPEKLVYKRINLGSIPSHKFIREKEKKQRLQAILETQKHKLRFAGTLKICTLRKMALKRKQYLEMSSAMKIQVVWRKRRRRRHIQARGEAAIKIQSFERMQVQRRRYINFEYERLCQYKSSRHLASIIQPLWRGYKGRSIARREREKSSLPDPSDPLNFEFWLSLQSYSYPPSRTWGSYLEYVLSGKPCSWQERNQCKRDGKYFKDVKFYTHKMTRQAYWDQPEDWKKSDRHDYEYRLSCQQLGFTYLEDAAARKLQRIWRSRYARKHLKMVLAAERILSNAAVSYETDPENMTTLCNYAFYTHIFCNDLEKSSLLYEKCLNRMNSRGGDHPFILYSYAIYDALTGGSVYEHYVKRAKMAEQRFRARTKGTSSMYDISNAYIRYVALIKQSASAWQNYALCR